VSEALDRLSAALADRYKIERELGQGGMATVYLAHDVKHDRQVALKVMRPELAAVIGADRFLAEIKTTAHLQHSHILPLHDSGEVDGTVFYVMPYIDGESLRDWLDREQQLPVTDAVRIASQVASALDYAHRHGVIHRDIKPENILLHDGSAMVADFGIALAASRTDGGSRMTETGMSLGTPTYMSPEQAMGQRTLDARTDIYALGCVLYESLAGEPPFTGPTPQAIVAKVMTTAPTQLSELRSTVPMHVAEAVHTALLKLPADRLATAAAFAGTGFTPAWAPRRGLDWRLALAAGILLGTALGVAFMARRAPSGAATALDQRQQLTFNGRTTNPAIASAGAWVACTDESCQHGIYDLCTSTLLVQEIGSTQAISIIQEARALSAPRWSHDGSQLVVAGQLDATRAGLFVVPRSGGVVRMIGPEGVFDTDASGDTVVVMRANPGRNTTLLFLTLATGQVADSVPAPLTGASPIAWSPNGRYIAALSADKVLVVFDRTGIETGRQSFIARESVRWNVAGDAVLLFAVGAVKEDELVRVPVDGEGRLSARPTVLLARVPTLYQGRFDVARRSGRMIVATGEAVTDLWTYALTLDDPVHLEQARGTTRYGNPTILPDGTTLSYGRGDALGENIYALTLESGREEALGAERFPFGTGVRCAADGRRVAFGHSTSDGPRLDGLELSSRRPFSQMAAGQGAST